MEHPPDEETVSSLLAAPLADAHLDLLETIFWPIVETQHSWPVWDYVTRALWRLPGVAGSADAYALFNALPSVPRGIQQPFYSHVWRETFGTYEPALDTRVGLTVAGLTQLRSRRPAAGDLADLCIAIIARLAHENHRLEPDPTTPVTLEVPVAEYVREALPAYQRTLRSVSTADVLDVLQREFAPLNIVRQADGTATAKLGVWLAPYRGLRTADDYLDIIGVRTTTPGLAGTATPLQLTQMLDHLSLVLQTHPAWTGRPLIAAPDLRAAASLVLPVADEEQFRDRMAGLAAILTNLQAPAVPVDDAKRRYGTDHPGSLQRLDHFLRHALTHSDGLERATTALNDVREAVRIRVEHHHPTTDTRRRAAQAKARLGLPDPILDWSAAWNHIRAVLAESFDVIRQEIQLAPRPQEGR